MGGPTGGRRGKRSQRLNEWKATRRLVHDHDVDTIEHVSGIAVISQHAYSPTSTQAITDTQTWIKAIDIGGRLNVVSAADHPLACRPAFAGMTGADDAE